MSSSKKIIRGQSLRVNHHMVQTRGKSKARLLSYQLVLVMFNTESTTCNTANTASARRVHT